VRSNLAYPETPIKVRDGFLPSLHFHFHCASHKIIGRLKSNCGHEILTNKQRCSLLPISEMLCRAAVDESIRLEKKEVSPTFIRTFWLLLSQVNHLCICHFTLIWSSIHHCSHFHTWTWHLPFDPATLPSTRQCSRSWHHPFDPTAWLECGTQQYGTIRKQALASTVSWVGLHKKRHCGDPTSYFLDPSTDQVSGYPRALRRSPAIFPQCRTRTMGQRSTHLDSQGWTLSRANHILNYFGFSWKVKSNDILWIKQFNSLVLYKKTHGDCNMTTSKADDVQLTRWVERQRRAKKNGNLSEERIEKLNNLGFVWSVRGRCEAWSTSLLNCQFSSTISIIAIVSGRWRGEASVCCCKV
jgi:hypothetical protein